MNIAYVSIYMYSNTIQQLLNLSKKNKQHREF